MASPTTLIMSERFRRHDTGDHPENPRRLDAIERHLAAVGLLDGRPVVAPRPPAPAAVALCHDERYVRLIESVCASGGGWLDGDTYACAESYETALLAAGAAIQAVDLVLDLTLIHNSEPTRLHD
ncbi:MAG: histone deacetylase, partial [Thermomicrobiaceae bacterium]|nr:histone deacetylase [Thermomicrobiaceae bacterium]